MSGADIHRCLSVRLAGWRLAGWLPDAGWMTGGKTADSMNLDQTVIELEVSRRSHSGAAAGAAEDNSPPEEDRIDTC